MAKKQSHHSDHPKGLGSADEILMAEPKSKFTYSRTEAKEICEVIKAAAGNSKPKPKGHLEINDEFLLNLVTWKAREAIDRANEGNPYFQPKESIKERERISNSVAKFIAFLDSLTPGGRMWVDSCLYDSYKKKYGITNPPTNWLDIVWSEGSIPPEFSRSKEACTVQRIKQLLLPIQEGVQIKATRDRDYRKHQLRSFPLFQFGLELGEIYKETTGKTPTRHHAGEKSSDCGPFHTFVSSSVKPTGLLPPGTKVDYLVRTVADFFRDRGPFAAWSNTIPLD